MCVHSAEALHPYLKRRSTHGRASDVLSSVNHVNTSHSFQQCQSAAHSGGSYLFDAIIRKEVGEHFHEGVEDGQHSSRIRVNGCLLSCIKMKCCNLPANTDHEIATMQCCAPMTCQEVYVLKDVSLNKWFWR